MRSTSHAGRKPAGFTLTELLVVISVLGVLAGVVVFAVGGINDRGQASACAEDARTIRTAEESNFAQSGSYVSEAQLVTNGLLGSQSSIHDVALSGKTYSVTDVGTCASGTAGASTLPVTGSALWLDATDAPSVTVQSGIVTQWNDKSGSGRNFTPLQSPSTVTYNNVGLNGKPAIVTTGTDLGNQTVFGPSASVFVVAKMTGSRNSRIIGGITNNWLLGWWNGYEDQAYFEGWVNQPSKAATTNAIMYSSTMSAGNGTVWRNGTQLASNGGGTTAPAGLQIGGDWYTNGERSNAAIGEVVVYNSALSATQRQQVESYLMTKWAITPGS